MVLRLGWNFANYISQLHLPADFLLDPTFRIHREKTEEGTSFLFSLVFANIAQKHQLLQASSIL